MLGNLAVPLNKGIAIVELIMDTACRRADVKVKPENVAVRFEQGVPVALNGEGFADAVA